MSAANQVQQGHSVCHEVSCGRWASGAVGITLLVCAIAFLILGNMQPDWFTNAVGLVGNPLSWALWTISGAGLALGGGLIAYVVVSRKSTDAEVPNFFKLDPKAPEHVKNSFHAKTNFEDLFVGEQFWNEIGEYKAKLPETAEIQDRLMTQSVMKGYIEGDGEIPFIALKTKCVSEDQLIANRLIRLPAYKKMTGDAAEQFKQSEIDKSTFTIVLLFFRDGGRWRQWSTRYRGEYCEINPSFLVDHGTGYLEGYRHLLNENSEELVQKEEEGFAKLKELMQGKRVTDHHGLEWELV